MKPAYYILVGISWVIWFLPFLLRGLGGKAGTNVKDRRALWGILLQGIGYALLWLGPFWLQSAESWRTALAIVFF